MSDSLDMLRDEAARLLDCTHPVDARGPRTFQARWRLATWLDIGVGSLRQVGADIAWLRSVELELAQRGA